MSHRLITVRDGEDEQPSCLLGAHAESVLGNQTGSLPEPTAVLSTDQQEKRETGCNPSA